MAAHLDLEEQEQLESLKHFWDTWGNLITWVLIAVLGTYAAFNGWHYWQARKGGQASVLYTEIERAAGAGDLGQLERALADMQSHYGGTAYAAHSALLAAQTFEKSGKNQEAAKALSWAADKATDKGLRSVARLRLASLQTGDKAYDEALKTLSASFPKTFSALAADRRGDVYLLQGRRDEAAVEYGKAYQGLSGEQSGYQNLVGVKLNALGVNPRSAARLVKAS